jgi:predicted alpha/beta hydrolase family esterase
MSVEILFVQGGGPNVHDDWDQTLVDNLVQALGPTYRVRYPRMPNEADPHYATWKPALTKELQSLDDGAILVGHSVGGTMLIHLLAESSPQFRPRVLVLISAPFIGEGGWPSDELPANANFDLSRLPAPVLLYHGTDDDTVPTKHASLYAQAIPNAVLHVLDGRDHQLNNDLSDVAQGIRSLER